MATERVGLLTLGAFGVFLMARSNTHRLVVEAQPLKHRKPIKPAPVDDDQPTLTFLFEHVGRTASP